MMNDCREAGTILNSEYTSDEAVASNSFAPQAFPPRLIILLEEIAGGSVWRYSDGTSMVEDGKAALAWIEEHSGLPKPEEEDPA